MSTSTLVILVVVILAVVGVVVWLMMNKRRTDQLRGKFGPEYERTLQSHGDVHRAEAELAERAKRVEKLHIAPLSATDRERFTALWQKDQALFVDDPKLAISEADALVTDVMRVRGYPMSNFEQRAADISVEHPRVVEHYRAARKIAERKNDPNTTLEDLRQSLIHYRALFDDLLGGTAREEQGTRAR